MSQNPTRALIADDEAPARNKMVRMLQEPNFEHVEIINISTNGLDAYQYIQLLKPDVAFLDIEMPGMTGLEIAESLPPELRPTIVFATAYNEHAIKAFELNAIDYLLKPFSIERLAQTFERIEARKGERTDSEGGGDYVRLAEQLGMPAFTKIPVPIGDKIKLIDFDEVVSIEVEDRITHIYTLNKTYPINITLDTFEKRLPSTIFFRISRSAIVNVQAIQEIVAWFGNRYKVSLINKREVVSSREKSRALKAFFKF
jgi:two-component system LytT family response regulator